MTPARNKAVTCFIGLGSNLDDPAAQVRRGFDILDAAHGIELAARSSLYRSAPIGVLQQPDFVNAVARVNTSYSALDLLDALKKIERLQGRKRGVRWGPRVIDLDLLVYGDEVIDELRLRVPHPGISERNFVLLPLMEIAPELVIPGLGRVADLAVDLDEPRISLIA